MAERGEAEGPDWDDARVFLAVARAGSLTLAARRLGVSQPTAGRRLRRLEGVLGGPLFERLPNRLEPTPLGRELLAAAEAMDEAAASLLRRARARSATALQPVRVTATASVSLFLAGRMGELLDALEGSGAEITLVSTRATLNLARREAEVALRMRAVPAEGDLVVRRLGRLAFAVYAARGRPDAGAAVVGLPATDRTPSQSRWLDRHAEARGAVVRLRASELSLRHRAARDGLGATLLPCFLGDADKALVRLGAPPPELAQDVHQLVHRDTRALPAVRAVATALAALFRRHAEVLEGSVTTDG